MTKHTRIYIWTLLTTALLTLNACDSGTAINDPDLGNQSNPLTETVRYVYGHFESGEPHSVQVTLDPDFVQRLQTFNTFDDYYDQLDGLMQRQEMTVNKALYRQLIHALHPAEISLLDTTGAVIIGEYLYISTEEASYRRAVGASMETQEVEEYWGKDGKAVEHELATVYRYMDDPEILATHSFRNPHIQTQVESAISGVAMKAPSYGSYITKDTLKSDDYSICLPTARSAEAGITPRCYPIRFVLWNQSTSTKKRRAVAGIEAFVELPGGEWVPTENGPLGIGTRIRLSVTAIGGHSERTASCYGYLRVGDLDLSKNPPYTFQRSAKNCNYVTVTANRKPGRGAQSKNSVGFEDFFSPATLKNGKSYLVFSHRGGWAKVNYKVD